MTGCTYVTSLDRECGREATTGQHCDFHAVLAQLDDFDFHDPAPITVPASVRPVVDRILSDVQANFDAMPTRQSDITRDMGLLIGMGRTADVDRWMRWTDSPAVWIDIPLPNIHHERHDQ